MKRNKVLKFLGEGVLIILSVLIAFLIEEYRDSRNERESCISYLKSIREDLVRDTLYYTSRIKDFDSIMINSDLLLDVVEHGDPFPKWFFNEDNGNFEEALYSILLPINFQNNPSYESMKANGDLKLIKDLSLQVELNKHYSHSRFADVAVNTELKRITQSRRDFIHHSNLFGLTSFHYVDEARARRILNDLEMYTIIYDSRQVVSFAREMMRGKKEASAVLIKKVDEYLNTQ
jgi:hypothetical protein